LLLEVVEVRVLLLVLALMAHKAVVALEGCCLLQLLLFQGLLTQPRLAQVVQVVLRVEIITVQLG
jgi:hypothetical protein